MLLHIQAVQKDEISGYGRSGMASLKSNKDAELLMKVLGNPEMAALLTSLAKTMKV